MHIDTSLSDEELKIRSGSFTVGQVAFNVSTRQAYVDDGQHHAAYVDITASRDVKKFAALPEDAAGKSVSGESAQQALHAMGMNTQQAQAVESVRVNTEGNSLRIQFKEQADAALVQEAQMRVIEQAVQKNVLPRESLLALNEAEILPVKKTIGVEFNDFGNKVKHITIPNTENTTGHELRLFVHPDGQVTVHTGAQHKTREVLGEGEAKALAQVGKALGVPQDEIQRMVSVGNDNPLRQVNTDKSVPEILQALELHKMISKGTAAQVAEFVASESVSMEHVVKLKDAKHAAREAGRRAERRGSHHIG